MIDTHYNAGGRHHRRNVRVGGYYNHHFPASTTSTTTPVKKRRNDNNNTNNNNKRGQMKRFLESLQMLALVLVFCLFTLHYGKALPKLFRHPHFKHVIIIDAGSTGTRCHVFRVAATSSITTTTYGKDASVTPKLILPTKSFKTTPGLSARALDPSGIDAALRPLLNFARESVPMENWKETQIHLMATAGLRHIEQHLSESIIDACRETLRESPFSFEKDEWASVLPGTKEASYGWTAVNYAFNALSPEKPPKETYGVLELGGASMQVTYAVPHATAKNVVQKKHKETVRVGNSVKHLYASSLLGLGHEAARAEYHAMLRREYETTGEKPNNPCTNRGWTPQTTVQHGEALAVGAGPSKPTGNFTACYAMTKKLLGLAENTKDCPRTPCGMRKEHLPPFDGKFLATENFHYTAEFFKLGKTTTIRDFQRAGEKLCAESWGDVVKKRFRKDQKKWEEIDLSKYCFSAAFIVAMLKDGMLLPEDLKFTVGNNVGRYNVDWAMGAAINTISSKIAAASILTPDNSVGRSASASASDIAAAAGLAPSSASSHTHEANDMFWWCVYILAGFFGCSKFVFSGVWEMLYFKCVSIVRRTRENRRRLRNARRNGDSDNSRGVGRRGSRSGSDGSSLIGGGGGLRRNGSRSLSSSVSNLRGSFNRSRSGFLTSLPSRKGSFHDLSDIDSLV